jgi:hypothetical protein
MEHRVQFIKDAIIDVLRPGKRQRTNNIARLVDESTKQVAAALKAIERNPPKGMILDTLHSVHGNRHMLFYRPDSGTPAAVALDAVSLVKKCIKFLTSTESMCTHHPTQTLDHMGKLLRMLDDSVPTALPLLEECIAIMHQPVVGRPVTLALDHMWKVLLMLDALLTRTTTGDATE